MNYATYRKRWVCKHFRKYLDRPMEYPSEFVHLSDEQLQGYLYALAHNGDMGDLFRDAERMAKLDKDFAKVNRYRNMAEQFGNVMAPFRR